MFDFISRYFWLLALIITAINAAVFRTRANERINASPELAEGYALLLRGYLIAMSIPCIVMGIGCTVGGLQVWDYFNPRAGNPYVLAWYASIVVLWSLGTYWLFFRDGAEMLVKHPGLVTFRMGFSRTEISNPTVIKAFWLLCLAGGIVAVVMMSSWNFVPPSH